MHARTMRAVSPLSSVAPAPNTPDCCTCTHAHSGSACRPCTHGLEPWRRRCGKLTAISAFRRGDQHDAAPPAHDQQAMQTRGSCLTARQAATQAMRRRFKRLCPPKNLHAFSRGIALQRVRGSACCRPEWLQRGGGRLWKEDRQGCVKMAAAVLSGAFTRLTLSRIELRPAACSHPVAQVLGQRFSVRGPRPAHLRGSHAYDIRPCSQWHVDRQVCAPPPPPLPAPTPVRLLSGERSPSLLLTCSILHYNLYRRPSSHGGETASRQRSA